MSKLMPIRALLLTVMCLLCGCGLLGQTQSGGASSTSNSPAPAADTDSADPGQADPESMLPHFADTRFWLSGRRISLIRRTRIFTRRIAGRTA